eukprot:CAMPEP_0183802410 /NCGR_PEP_ID=MMETSP0803_2-20130417/30290_1 /TAXON_ID=195967 /ORGANISM="Crustomastix stigmata, Strain CCMP3273" /LENGTH=127 /DNA_ID=CAMNT_0026047141 /DNA_START=30 /DNA_END=410 /DNA_ORIENTATION=-
MASVTRGALVARRPAVAAKSRRAVVATATSRHFDGLSVDRAMPLPLSSDSDIDEVSEGPHRLMPKREECDPYAAVCKVNPMVWATRCTLCGGMGNVKSKARRGKKAVISSCPMCGGVGAVRCSSVRV